MRSALLSSFSDEETEAQASSVGCPTVCDCGSQDLSPGCLVPEWSELCHHSASEEMCLCSRHCFKSANELISIFECFLCVRLGIVFYTLSYFVKLIASGLGRKEWEDWRRWLAGALQPFLSPLVLLLSQLASKVWACVITIAVGLSFCLVKPF